MHLSNSLIAIQTCTEIDGRMVHGIDGSAISETDISEMYGLLSMVLIDATSPTGWDG